MGEGVRGRGEVSSARCRAAALWGPALGVGLVALVVYLATLAPGLTWAHDSADGGELAAAAATLGISHPPGYPTYVLLAHPFTVLPVGEIATRTNLFSAICAAGAVALLTGGVTLVVRRPIAAIGAGLALAFAPLLWSQAIVTEVHALNALFGACLLVLAIRGRACEPLPLPRPTLLALSLGFAWGLSLGNHPTALFYAPLASAGLGRLRRHWGAAVVGFALGLIIYLYLPLRALADPPINWGDPQTLERFWWMVSGGPYRQFVFSLPATHLPTRLSAWSGLWVSQFGWIGLLVTALGGVGLWTTDRPLLAAGGVTVSLASAFAVGYDTTDSYLYLIPALVCLALWLGVGVDRLLDILAGRMLPAAEVAAVLVIPLVAWAAAGRFSTLDRSEDRVAGTFVASVLRQAPPNAIILSERDGFTFALWYGTAALGRRPDVAVVDLGLLGYGWYAEELARQQDVSWPREAFPLEGEEGLRRVVEATGRPACRIASEAGALVCLEPTP